MAPYTGVELVFGGAAIGYPDQFYKDNDARVFELYEILKKKGIKKIDVAQIYYTTEEDVGRTGAATKHGFQIDTKWGGGYLQVVGGVSLPSDPGEVRRLIFSDAKSSLEKIGVDQVDVYYVHAPVVGVPLEAIVQAMNDVYEAGMFRRFGLSNYSPEDVQRVHDIAKANGWVLPTVYQGNYNAIARLPEDDLFPVLRRLGISFYAYSAVAGGFLAKTRAQVEAGEGRFDGKSLAPGFQELYNHEKLKEALDRWCEVAEEEGVSGFQLAMRWAAFHSAMDKERGDGIILGAKDNEQLLDVFEVLEQGPLSSRAVRRVDEVWAIAKEKAPTNNYEILARK